MLTSRPAPAAFALILVAALAPWLAACDATPTVIPDALVESPPPHIAALRIINRRATPVRLLAARGDTSIDVPPFGETTLPYLLTRTALFTPANFEHRPDTVGLRPRPGVGALCLLPAPGAPPFLRADGPKWTLRVDVGAGEVWTYELTPGDCLFDGTPRAVEIDADEPIAWIDLCE